MGLYDGKDPLKDQGSTAEIAILLQAPVILVIDIQSMARSAAAVVKGYQALNPAVQIAGVIVNRAGSRGHVQLVQAAIEKECGIPVLGWLGREEELKIPDRHLGLIPAEENEHLSSYLQKLVERIERQVDLERLLAIAQAASEIPEPPAQLFTKTKPTPSVTIAVAKDAAFHFYYPENLALLEQAGAKLHFFSPLHGELVPEEADGLFLGSSFSDKMLAPLAAQTTSIQSIATNIFRGMPTFAECGGYMYLCQQCLDRYGNAYPLAGVIPAIVQIQEKRAALGYREVRALRDNPLFQRGERAWGHEFHYSVIVEKSDDFPAAYESRSRWGNQLEGFAKGNLLAGFTHLYFASAPLVVKRWITACQKYRQQKEEKR